MSSASEPAARGQRLVRATIAMFAAYGAARRACKVRGARVHTWTGRDPETLRETWTSRPLLATETAALVAFGAVQGAFLAPLYAAADLRDLEARVRGIDLEGGEVQQQQQRRTSPVDFAFD